MPVLPASLFEPLWVQFSALLPEHPRVVPTHPLGCHRERIADRLVFEHVVAALVHGSGYERIAPLTVRIAPFAVGWRNGPSWDWRNRCMSWPWRPTTA